MTGAVLAMLGATASGGGGGGGGLTGVASPDPIEWYFNGSAYTASISAGITGGLPPYTVEWFVSDGSVNILFASNSALTVESVFGDDCDVYFQVTDANSTVATSNTLTITLPA